MDALGQFIEAEAREMLQNVFLVVDIVNATTSKTEDFSVILKALVEMVPSSEELDSLEICNDLIKGVLRVSSECFRLFGVVGAPHDY